MLLHVYTMHWPLKLDDTSNSNELSPPQGQTHSFRSCMFLMLRMVRWLPLSPEHGLRPFPRLFPFLNGLSAEPGLCRCWLYDHYDNKTRIFVPQLMMGESAKIPLLILMMWTIQSWVCRHSGHCISCSLNLKRGLMISLPSLHPWLAPEIWIRPFWLISFGVGLDLAHWLWKKPSCLHSWFRLW